MKEQRQTECFSVFFFLCVDKLLFEGRGRGWWGGATHPDCHRTGRELRSGQTFRPSSRLRTPDWTKGAVRQVARGRGHWSGRVFAPFCFSTRRNSTQSRGSRSDLLGAATRGWSHWRGGATRGRYLPPLHRVTHTHTRAHTHTHARVRLQQMMFYIYRNKVKKKKKEKIKFQCDFVVFCVCVTYSAPSDWLLLSTLKCLCRNK